MEVYYMKKALAIILAVLLLLSMTACIGRHASVGIIGGADGPTAIYVTGG